MVTNDVKNIRNECLFNSFVMYELVRRKKEESRKSLNKIKLFNTIVILLSLIIIAKVFPWDIVNEILSLVAIIFAILIFIYFPKEPDTRIAYTTANSYWDLVQTLNLIIWRSPSTISNADQLIIDQCLSTKSILTKYSPVFKDSDTVGANKALEEVRYMYTNKFDRNSILEYFHLNQ